MLDRDMVSIVRQVAPKYDKYLHSKVKRPDLYGVALTDKVQRYFLDSIAQGATAAPVPPKRKKPYRITVWFTQRELERLQLALNAKGYDTIQEYVHELVTGDIANAQQAAD